MSVKHGDSDVTLKAGASSVKVLKHGATVLSWKVNGKEQLFLSEKAVLDGSKAVRGGIPLVFPVFGKATEGPCAQLPQHGFARNHEWEFLGQVSSDPLTVQFGLGPEQLSDDAKAAWGYDFTLIYTLKLTEDSLVTALSVENTGSDSFEFNVLLHTYFRIDDISEVSVKGLAGCPVNDKVSKTQYSAENADVTIGGEVDRVYSNVNGKVVINCGKSPRFEIQDRVNLPDMVVWNPWIEKANGLGDFYPKEGYKNMICAEAGRVGSWEKIEPGAKWEASQTLKSMI